MAAGEVVEFADRVVGRWYKWHTLLRNTVECAPHENGAYEHRDWAKKTTSSYAGLANFWDGVDRNKWPRTWGFLVRFRHSDDFHKNTRWGKSQPTEKEVYYEGYE